jgi:hypothetical protein
MIRKVNFESQERRDKQIERCSERQRHQESKKPMRSAISWVSILIRFVRTHSASASRTPSGRM